jgi:hypothetical protein
LSGKKLDPKITSKLSVPFGDIELKTKWAYWPVLAATGKNENLYSKDFICFPVKCDDYKWKINLN